MSVLVVGLSHKSAPVAILERAALSGDALGKLLGDVFEASDVAGSFVVSSCNRVEVYAEVARFHGSVSAISELLARHSGVPLPKLTRHLYVHYEDRAIQHLLSVTCGLDSMVIGESQVLGQVRQALRVAGDQRTLGRALSDLGSVALRAGKRAHAETGIDRAGASLVSVGLAAGARRLGAAEGQDGDALSGLSVLVVGAGSMSSLAVATAARMGAGRIVVANRSSSRAQRLVARVAGTVPAAAADLSRLPEEIAAADLVVSCTGASGRVIGADVVAAAISSRPAPLVVIDLALPRDVDPAAGRLPGVSLIDLESIGRGLGGGAHEEDVAAVRRIVAEELAARVSADRAAQVAPTVVALRAKAAEVVDAELDRLTGRLGDLDARARREIAQSMRRIVDKLLHAPTVRVKELAGAPGGNAYEAVLRVLFDLEPDAVQTVTRADVVAPKPLPRQTMRTPPQADCD
jgi:glutamyl-tRNA reductase